jgi:hypothetical protein
MATSRRNVVRFALVGALLGVFFSPFSTSATPTFTQGFMRSPAASAGNPDSPHMKGMELFDYIFALGKSFTPFHHILIAITQPALFIFLMAFYIWYTWYEGRLSFDSLGVPDVADCDSPSFLPTFPHSSYIHLFTQGWAMPTASLLERCPFSDSTLTSSHGQRPGPSSVQTARGPPPQQMEATLHPPLRPTLLSPPQ